MPTTAKERILAEIRQDEVVGLARDLVSIPSYTTEETAVAEFLHAFFRREHGWQIMTCARVFGATIPDVCG